MKENANQNKWPPPSPKRLGETQPVIQIDESKGMGYVQPQVNILHWDGQLSQKKMDETRNNFRIQSSDWGSNVEEDNHIWKMLEGLSWIGGWADEHEGEEWCLRLKKLRRVFIY